MRIAGFAVVVSMVLASATASAGIRLCVKPRGPGVAIAPGATIVVRRGADFDVREETTHRPIHVVTARPIDDDWQRITVDAKLGESFYLTNVAGAWCGLVVYRVVKDAKGDPDADVVSFAETEAHISPVARGWTLYWKASDNRTWSVARWATELADLGGNKATVQLRSGSYSYAYTDLDVTTIYVRITSYHLDGTTSVETYKLTRTGEVVSLALVPEKA